MICFFICSIYSKLNVFYCLKTYKTQAKEHEHKNREANFKKNVGNKQLQKTVGRFFPI